MYHVEVDGISLCHVDLSPQIFLEGYDNNISLICQSKSLTEINDIVDFLFARGYNAITVEGPCKQRDL
jgi:hypothetical protein